MKKFEYKIKNLRTHGLTSMVLTAEHEKLLNTLGDEGWELVGISKNANGRNVMAVFKREKQE